MNKLTPISTQNAPPAALDFKEPKSPISPPSPEADELFIPESEPMCCLTACLYGIWNWLTSCLSCCCWCGPGEGLSLEEASQLGDVNRMLAFISKDEALHQLLLYNHYDKIPALLDAGADVNAPNEKGDTILHKLCSNPGKPLEVNGEPLIDILVARGAEVDAVGSRGRTPLIRACEQHGLGYATRLIENHGAHVHPVSASGTALHIACAKGHLGLIGLLTRNGASMMARDARQRTPLHHLASYVSNVSANDTIDIKGRAVPMVEFLAAQPGLDANARDQDGWTPLHLACKEGSSKKTDLLLKLKADPNASGPNGRRPIHYAAKFGHEEVMRLLAARRANVNAQDDRGDTPLLLLCRNPENLEHEAKKAAAQVLLELRADPKIPSHADAQGKRQVPKLDFLRQTKPPATKAEEHNGSTEEFKEPVKPVAADTKPSEALLLAASNGEGTFVQKPAKKA